MGHFSVFSWVNDLCSYKTVWPTRPRYALLAYPFTLGSVRQWCSSDTSSDSTSSGTSKFHPSPHLRLSHRGGCGEWAQGGEDKVRQTQWFMNFVLINKTDERRRLAQWVEQRSMCRGCVLAAVDPGSTPGPGPFAARHSPSSLILFAVLSIKRLTLTQKNK